MSERAEIVARFADLFTRPQLDALRAAEGEASDPVERERLYRLGKTCESGLVTNELAEREDAVANAILAARVQFQGEELPLRTAQAQLGALPEYADREELGRLQAAESASFNDERLELLRAGEELESEISGDPDPVARTEGEKNISLRELERALAETSEAAESVYGRLRETWFERLLGPEREETPSSYHTSYLRRLSPLEATYTKERSVEVCMDTLTKLGFDLANEQNIRLDLDDRPQKSPRACVIASDPPKVVHLITRAQGGLHDYQAFLHEAGHALHYAGVDPGAAVHVPEHRARPRADGDLLVHPRGRLGSPAGTSATSTSRPSRPARTPRRRRSWRRSSSAAMWPSSSSSSSSGDASRPTAERPTAIRSA